MSRAGRLLDLMERLRRRRRPVSGATLAAELGVSLRTLYRDITALQAQGADVEGEAGLGYVLRPGFTLPPLTLTIDEVEALALGALWVAERADPTLVAAAGGALAKLAAVTPADRAELIAQPSSFVGPSARRDAAGADLTTIRTAIRGERKLAFNYTDAKGAPTSRIVWPMAISYFDAALVLVAWCETRVAFRHFRIDRIAAVEARPERYPRRRAALIAAWRVEQRVPPDPL
ncbi:MAG: YafY family transcriptional regulator [Bradyrhizobium sp.]|nr:MAG: YafY family transcriptional regulator [Bradyrhizobium sp.]